jgi:hypothetical protein
MKLLGTTTVVAPLVLIILTIWMAFAFASPAHANNKSLPPEGARCFGYITGMLHALDITGWICVPSESSYGQHIKVVIAATDRFPEMLHKEAHEIVFAALTKTWPCGKKK